MSHDCDQMLASFAGQVNVALDRWLPEAQTDVCGNLNEAVRYSSLAGGKRIRAALCLMTAQGLGSKSEAALRAGCAFELIHTYSLIHDDLPAMDDDDLRRGRPTSHKVYGEAMAILAGDSLLTLAFSWFASLVNYNVGALDTLKIIDMASFAAGYSGMIGGQVLDLLGENQKVDLKMLENIHRRKTGALITAPVKTGAVIAGASERELLILEQFGEKAGLLFQIIDDILDVEGDTAVIGKTSGRDAELGKSTYPALLGLEGAKKYAVQTHDAAMSHLKELPRKIVELEILTDYLLSRQS